MVLRKCAVCKTPRKDKSYKLHCFPRDIERCTKWLELLGMKGVCPIYANKNYSLCHDHFDESMYNCLFDRTLYPWAVPKAINNPDVLLKDPTFVHDSSSVPSTNVNSHTSSRTSPIRSSPTIDHKLKNSTDRVPCHFSATSTDVNSNNMSDTANTSNTTDLPDIASLSNTTDTPDPINMSTKISPPKTINIPKSRLPNYRPKKKRQLSEISKLKAKIRRLKKLLRRKNEIINNLKSVDKNPVIQNIFSCLTPVVRQMILSQLKF